MPPHLAVQGPSWSASCLQKLTLRVTPSVFNAHVNPNHGSSTRTQRKNKLCMCRPPFRDTCHKYSPPHPLEITCPTQRRLDAFFHSSSNFTKLPFPPAPTDNKSRGHRWSILKHDVMRKLLTSTKSNDNSTQRPMVSRYSHSQLQRNCVKQRTRFWNHNCRETLGSCSESRAQYHIINAADSQHGGQITWETESVATDTKRHKH